MLGLIWRLIVGNFNFCRHEWKQTKVIQWYESGYSQPVMFSYFLTCEKCGDMKQKKFK